MGKGVHYTRGPSYAVPHMRNSAVSSAATLFRRVGRVYSFQMRNLFPSDSQRQKLLKLFHFFAELFKIKGEGLFETV